MTISKQGSGAPEEKPSRAGAGAGGKDAAPTARREGRHRALEALQTAVCILDSENRCLFANEMAGTLLGAPGDRLSGRRFDEVLPLPQAERLVGLVTASAIGGAPLEADLLLPSLGERRVRVFSGRYADPQTGEPLVIAHFEDVSWRSALEREVHSTRDLAENAARAKSEFIDNMTHELRTPLNGAIGMLDLLAATGLTSEQREYVELSQGANRHLLEIINDILDYAKIISGEFKLNKRDFSPQTLIRAVAGALKPQAESKGLSFVWPEPESLPKRLVGDDARIRQILFNILGNAVKFTRSGEVRLEMDCCFDGGIPGVRLMRFKVSDTGIGIAAEKLERIFDPFTQADGSYSRSFQGAGLGLGVVKRLVELMSGSILIKSEAGRGTVVEFSVSVDEPGSAPAVPEPETLCALTSPLKILLAEDDGTNQIMISRMLEKMGHRVYCVENGVEAIKALRAEPFDCILMDVQMPILSGLDASRTIRTAPGFKDRADTPIIAVTAHALRGDKERFMKAGVNDCLFKPFSVEELSRMLSSVLGEKGK